MCSETKKTHGMYGKRLYNIWSNMKQRCKNQNHISYKYYGAKGVRVCKEWEDFNTFKEWALANGYNDTMTIDRKNSDGDYAPNNCRWADKVEQSNNRSCNLEVFYKGKRHTAAEIAKKIGLDYSAVVKRIKMGWDAERIFNEPSRKEKRNGK